MPSEPPTTTTHRRPTTTTTTKPPQQQPPPEPEHLPCPRCDSTNTKFCYYNNYNFSQPRHFCKACRRYWTHGGTLRDIPIGGGSRKNAKRSRLTTHNHHNNININNNNNTLEFRHMAPPTTTPFLIPFTGDHQFLAGGKPAPATIDSFTSLLNGNCVFGGYEDVGFGFGRGVWPFTGVGDSGYMAAGGGGGGNGWQVESGEGGECFSLPDLAISTPGMI